MEICITANIIVITKRSNDYHVCIKGHPMYWECGKTVVEAIGKFILTHGNVVI